MSSVLVSSGNIIPLSLLLEDQNESKFVRAILYAPDGSTITTLTLTHKSNGVYTNNSFPMPVEFNNVYVLYEVFDDSGFSIKSDDLPDLDIVNKDNASSSGVSVVDGTIIGIVDDSTEVVGIVDKDDDDLVGTIDEELVVGTLIEDEPLVGVLDSDEITGTVEGEI